MKRLQQKRLEVPNQVSGRPVTNRGVHLQPFGYHGFWLDREAEDSYWTKLLTSMGISWVVILTESDSVLEERHGTNPLKVWLDHGIIPIIRDKQLLPRGFANMETVKRTVDLYAQYGLRPFWQLYNEPFDSREWKDGKVPAYNEAWKIIATRWSEGARQVVAAGAYVGFPDGPCYAENPFERLRSAESLEFFERGMAFYAPHNYGLGRPLWYPYDAVTRYGAELNEIAYRRLLDDYADYPNWHDAPVESISQQRREWADPVRTAITDDTCWRGWEKTVAWAMDSLGFVPPMAMTEGGWTPRARAGVDPTDNRWSYATPRMVAKKTLQMYDTPSPFFAICPWLLATSDMGGTGWFDDAWHGGAFSDKYGSHKPVINLLAQTLPKEIKPRTEPMVIDVDGDTRDWTWVRQVYGASYRRGAATELAETSPEAEEEPVPILRLIQVHEYEGPRSCDVVVVDSAGLPVEGIEFYYHEAAVPPTDGGGPGDHPAYESRDRTMLGATDAGGRASFPMAGLPRAPVFCPGTLWPRGKGDVLDNLGRLANTNNRHLNSVWQLVDEDLPLPEETGMGSGHGTGPLSSGEPGGESLPGWAMAVEYRPGARIIAGSLPREGIDVTVSDPWGNLSTVRSGSKLEYGPGGFEVVAPHVAIYTLTFLDQTFEVQTHDGATLVTLTQTAVPPAEPEPGPEEGGPEGDGGQGTPAGWVMVVEYRPGPRIIAGSLPDEGIDVTVSDPWGNLSTVCSGSKPEHGLGGFEVVAPHVTTYTLTFLDQTFEVQTHDGVTLVTLIQTEVPPAEPEPETEITAGGNKLGFYCEVTTIPGLHDAIRDVQPRTLLTHANDRGLLQAMRRYLSLDTFVIGRLHVDPQVQDAWLGSMDPEGIGRAFAEQVLSHDFAMATERGESGRLLIDAWMTLNECVPGPASQAYQEGTEADRQAIRRKADAYDRFQVAFRDRLKEADSELEAVALNLGAGNFQDTADCLNWFPRTLASYVYLGFHEYGWPALSVEVDPEAKSSAGAYRPIMQGIRQQYGPRHQVIITEAGLARLFKHSEFPPGDVGWLYPGETISQQSYWRSLAWYNDLLWEDDYVLGACLFEVGHGGARWETFRHLGVDNQGNPLQIMAWIKGLRDRETAVPLLPSVTEPVVYGEAGKVAVLRGRVISSGQPVRGVLVRVLGSAETLGADPWAAAHSPSAVTWTQAIGDFQGHVWNCWQKFVAPKVAGITWQEFRARVAEYNPSLRDTGGRFEAGRTYYLPENQASLCPEILWDREVHDLSGTRWTCWKNYVRTKVFGLSWEAFREEVVARNTHLAEDDYHFVVGKSYLLPRSAGQDLYARADQADERGRYTLKRLPTGSYNLEVVAEGYRPLQRSIQALADLALDLEIESDGS